VGSDPLATFNPATRAWFEATFQTPTRAQELDWPAIAAGDSVLVLAPTGSGKTLAAFLAAIDHLMFSPAPKKPATRIVYISPLKALAVDVERNLREPLAWGFRFVSRPSRSAPGIRPRASGRGISASPPTSSSPRPSRCT
jgi:Lhr-like helicase